MNMIEYLKPSQIRVDPGNVYTHADGDIQRLTHSIQEHGFLMPLVVDAASKQGLNGDASYELVGGEARLEAAKICQLAEIPCTIATFTDKKQRDLAAVALNAGYGTWDDTKLATLLQELQSQGADLDDTGLKPHELDELLASINPAAALTDPDDVPKPPETPITQRGDLITLGNHRLLCGDSTIVTDIEALMDGKQADMVWTDPPYGVSYQANESMESLKARNRRTDGLTVENDSMTERQLTDFLHAVFGIAWGACKPGGAWYVAAPPGPLHLVFGKALNDLSIWRQTLQWVKQQFVFGRTDYHYRNEPIFYGWKEGAAHYFVDDHTQDSIWEIDRPRTSKEHPTMKPVALIERALNNSSKPGQLVLDPFGGSGSTLIAAESTGRRAFLCEIDPKYCDVIVERWQSFTGKKAIRPAAKAA